MNQGAKEREEGKRRGGRRRMRERKGKDTVRGGVIYLTGSF